jgi:hypothetical protein
MTIRSVPFHCPRPLKDLPARLPIPQERSRPKRLNYDVAAKTPRKVRNEGSKTPLWWEDVANGVPMEATRGNFVRLTRYNAFGDNGL